MRALEQLEDIQITEELSVGDLRTIEECDDGLATLTRGVIDIEGQIDIAKALAIQGQYSDPVWFAKAKAALSWKKAGLQAIQKRRAAMVRAEKLRQQNSRDRLLLDEIKAGLPAAQFAEFVRLASLRHPHVFRASMPESEAA